MAAPTNTSFATAIDIGTTLPYTTTQRVDDAGTTYTVWYKYTAQPGDTEISVFGYGGGGSYTARVHFWLTDSIDYLDNHAIDVPSQIPVVPGTTYAWEFVPPGGNPSPANLSLTVKRGPIQALATGQIAINDSTDGYPAVVMDPATAEPLSFHHPFASGESVAVLKSGLTCAADLTNDRVLIYNPDLTLKITPTMPGAGYSAWVGTNQLNSFWIGKDGGAGHAFMVLMQIDGTFGTPIDLGSSGLKSLAPNQDNSKVYFIKDESTANQPVKVVNTSTFVVSNFLAGVAGYDFRSVNLMTLTDDTVLVHYAKTGSASYIERRNPDGTLANTYTLAVNAQVQHLFADPADPDYFWFWTENPAGTNTFTRVKVSDGSIDHVAGPWVEFIEGDSQDTPSATPSTYFGADFSCDPWIIRAQTPVITDPIRRLRQFNLPSSDDNHQMFMANFQVLAKTGVGLIPDGSGTPVQGQDPQVMISISRDGGQTWSPERWVSAGVMGKFLTRIRWIGANGKYRNGVMRFVVDDPVDWNFVSAMADIQEGSS